MTSHLERKIPTAAKSESIIAKHAAAAEAEIRRRIGDQCGDILSALGIDGSVAR